MHRLELLEDSPTGQIQRLLPLLPGGLMRRKSLFRFVLRGRGGGLLLLDRFAFPSSSHESIIASPLYVRTSALDTRVRPETNQEKTARITSACPWGAIQPLRFALLTECKHRGNRSWLGP